MQKKFLLIAVMAVFVKFGHSQSNMNQSANDTMTNQIGIGSKNMTSFKIPYQQTTHIVSPEPILYVDISSPNVEGDLPEKNIFRLKPITADNENGHIIGVDESFVVTIVTQTFIISYKLSFDKAKTPNKSPENTAFILTIDPTTGIQLNNYDRVTRGDYDRLSIKALSNKRKVYNVRKWGYGIEFWLNNVYVVGDLILIDLGAKNHTNLQYDLNSVGFKLTDSYRVNAAVSQELEIKPLYSFAEDGSTVFDRKWRNFYILRKFTFPMQKMLRIEMTEKQISGRPVTLSVDYNHILKAQTLAD